MDYNSSVIPETTARHAYIALEREASLGLIDPLHDDHPRLSSRYLLADRNYRQGTSLAKVEKRGLKPVVPSDGMKRSSQAPHRTGRPGPFATTPR